MNTLHNSNAKYHLVSARRFACSTKMWTIVFVAALAGCGGSHPSNGNGATKVGESHAAAASSASANPADMKSELERGYREMATRSYRLRENSTMAGQGGNTEISRMLEVVPPDRKHAIIGSFETISIGNDRYEKINGQWQRSTREGAAASRQTGDQMLRAIQSGITEIALVGNETVDGKPARIYQISSMMKIKETEFKGEYKIWLSTADGVPLKVEGKSTTPYAMQTSLTYEYDPNIKIEAPIP